jgi:hypothetical protein
MKAKSRKAFVTKSIRKIVRSLPKKRVIFQKQQVTAKHIFFISLIIIDDAIIEK